MIRTARIALYTMIMGFSVSPAASAATIDFTGAYDVSNWTFVSTFPAGQYTGGLDTSGAPAQIVLESDDWADGVFSEFMFLFTAFESALISFSWSYSTNDIDGPVWDPFGYMLGGTFYQLTDNAGSTIQSGVASFQVGPGDVFGFRTYANDSGFGAAVTTITNFQATDVPEPASILLLGTGLAAASAARRRRNRDSLKSKRI